MSDWIKINREEFGRLQVGDSVRAFHPLQNVWSICTIENILSDKRVWLKAECDEGFRFVVDLNNETLYLYEMQLNCTCGAKYTSNPNHHLQFCECNCEEF